ncbi:MAG: hypothetical protein ABII88_10000 [Candidatus Omnitrophota bacterium]
MEKGVKITIAICSLLLVLIIIVDAIKIIRSKDGWVSIIETDTKKNLREEVSRKAKYSSEYGSPSKAPLGIKARTNLAVRKNSYFFPKKKVKRVDPGGNKKLIENSGILITGDQINNQAAEEKPEKLIEQQTASGQEGGPEENIPEWLNPGPSFDGGDTLFSDDEPQ